MICHNNYVHYSNDVLFQLVESLKRNIHQHFKCIFRKSVKNNVQNAPREPAYLTTIFYINDMSVNHCANYNSKIRVL